MSYPPREKTPIILQMDSTECGAIALTIMLAYFGQHVSPSAVREMCDVSRDGSKAINIIKAARLYGLEAHGMQLTLEEVKQLPPPFIVYWQFNHFLIVEGFADNKVYINDPAMGSRTIKMTEFADSFTGVVLFLNPGAEFQPAAKPESKLFQLLRRYLSDYYGRCIYILLLVVTLALSIPIISTAFFAKIFLDNILLAGQRNWLFGLLLTMSIAAVAMGLLTFIKRYYLTRLYLKLKLTAATQFFWRILNLPMKFFQQRAAGDIADRIEAHGHVADIMTHAIANHIASLLTMVLLAVAMFLLSWPLALVNIGVTIISFLLLLIIARGYPDLGQRFKQAEAKLSAMEINGIQIIETLKANVLENQFFNQWAAHHAQKLDCEQRLEIHAGILKILPIFFQGLNIVILLILGCWFIIHGQLTPGGLVAMQILLFNFNRPLLDLLEVGNHIYKLQGEIARIADVNEQPSAEILSDTIDNALLTRSRAQFILELRHIRFGYSKLEPPAFNDISLQVQRGERIALVGPTGGGKSSLAKLICGLYQPWQGEILIQGVPLANISRSALADFAALVDQQIFLFAATVRDNLTLWNRKIADEEIYRALKMADMEEVVRQRGGLDCWVEECGKNFSGGQVQRLEIARALIVNPQLLILDEATSALDPLVEQQIYANLRQHQCTLIIIAHRLSAIRDCDQIIVMNQGEIVQAGNHQTLISNSGLYKELVSLEIQ